MRWSAGLAKTWKAKRSRLDCTSVTLALVLHDWRLVERIVGLTNRLGCALTRLDLHLRDRLYHATIDVTGPPDALRRLDAQLTRLLNDDKEMSR